MSTRTIRRAAAVIAAAAIAASAGLAALPASADEPYDITVHAGSSGAGTLNERRLVAYKLADYVDGTYVSIGDSKLDGVAVSTPDSLKPHLDRVLALTAGVSDVSQLPGWGYAADPSTGAQTPSPNAAGDPIAWLGGFRQTMPGDGSDGTDQASGSFGYGWNAAGSSSTSKPYAGSVREFADNLVRDDEAMKAVEQQPHSEPVDCTFGDSCTIPLTSRQGTGVYLVLDLAGSADWGYAVDGGEAHSYTVTQSAPMIVPTRADDADLAALDGKGPSDPGSLAPIGRLGEITVKNTVDEEVLPPCTPPQTPPDTPPNTPPQYPPTCYPKHRDETVATGQDAADNASDVWDTVPYVVSYRIPDLSPYKAAYDNRSPWIFNYRISDATQPGLRIDDAPTVTLDGQRIDLTKVDEAPAFAAQGEGTADGQPGEPDAWYYLQTDPDTDASHMVIGLGRWIVKHYGDLRAGDSASTLYGHQIDVRYTATVTDKILVHGNVTANDNWLDYTDSPSDVNGGSHHETPHVTVKQWTYDVDLTKRDSSTGQGLQGAEFTLAVKDNANASDSKPNGSVLRFVPASDESGDWRPARADENGTETVSTGENGRLRIRGLDIGSYTLSETRPAGGHQRLQSAEDITIGAKFEDDPSDFTIPNAQTEATLTITQNNRIALVRPMLAFSADRQSLPAGLSVDDAKAQWSGQDASGAWYADSRTSWTDAQLALDNQPTPDLARTGSAVTAFVCLLAGLVAAGAGLMAVKAVARRGARG